MMEVVNGNSDQTKPCLSMAAVSGFLSLKRSLSFVVEKFRSSITTGAKVSQRRRKHTALSASQ